jgi:mono/diheme cytochrome c family protein
MRKTLARTLVALVGLLLALAVGWVAWVNLGDEWWPEAPARGPLKLTPQHIERGAYLARAGNCATCHTARGGVPYAGGRGIETPFGTVFAGNLTPDDATGLGRWTPDEFWRALHHGRSRDGRLLYPAFPYPQYTEVTRTDSDALYAYLRSLTPVRQPNRPHALRFPYDTQLALAVWRALYFQPRDFEPDPAQPAAHNRGAYLVRGLGHCAACHGGRDLLGGPSGRLEFGGAVLAPGKWYAPSLHASDEAGVGHWTQEQTVRLLRDGSNGVATTLGPMAEVVWGSTQYLSASDLEAMATYLRALPAAPGQAQAATAAPFDRPLGDKLYRKRCAECHGTQGQGVPGAYPALAGNRAVTQASPHNPIQAVLDGGFAPATPGNPRPYGMPPYRLLLNDEEIAAVLSHIRTAWGNEGRPVTALEVQRAR